MGKLDGKVAIITGSSRGIGKDMALVFAREGAKVVVSARTEKEGDFRIPGSIETTVNMIREAGGEAIGIPCNVVNDDQVADLMRRTVAEWGRIDILVNNAAILIPGSIADMAPRHWDLLYRVNIRGPFICCKAAMPHMREQGYGHIINISSTAAIGPGPGPYPEGRGGGVAYGACKAHVERFSQGLAAELWEDGIAVNVLSPARGIASEGQRWFRQQAGSGSFVGSRENGEIMGDAAAIICSRDPKAYTGHILYDEPVLREAGIRDLSKYTIIQG